MRVVAIAAHPDDETGFAGGTLAKYATEGHEVIVVFVTRGEGGEVGDPPVGPKERLGEIREGEARCAATALAAADAVFLAFLDPSIEIGEPGRTLDVSLDELTAALAGCLAALHPDVVITHGSNGEYGHPQHIYTHQAVLAAVARLAPWRPAELLTWMANPNLRRQAPAGTTQPAAAPTDRLINKDDPADIVQDITPWLGAKAAALQCHRSQHAMIRRNSGKQDVADTLRRIEAFRRWPVQPTNATAT